MYRYAWIILGMIFLSNPLWGHGDLEARIAAKSLAIAATPQNAELYAERGFLYQQHEEWDAALTDYLQAQQLGLQDKRLHYRLAEIYLAVDLYQSGLFCTRQYLLQDSLDVKIHHLRGELFYRAQQYEQAIQAFHYVLNHAQDLTPENYITLAAVYFSSHPKGIDSVLWVIDQGLEKLGSRIFVLQEQKLYYLQQAERVTAVLQQYDLIISQLNRKERWYYQKANYLYEQQQSQEAKAALQLALHAFEQLKPHQQTTKAMLRLLARIHHLSQQLER